MIGQVDVQGLYLPWLMLLVAGALVATWVARRLLVVVGVYRWVWHPALFDLALFVLLLYGLSQASLLLQ
jgi:protein AaeX